MLTGTKVEGVEAGRQVGQAQGYGDQDLEVDYLVIAGGRGADVEPLNLSGVGLELDDGKIKVDAGAEDLPRRDLRDRGHHAGPRARAQGPGGGRRRRSRRSLGPPTHAVNLN